MAADIVVFDPNTIIDHATYEDPALPSEGVKHVFVNGVLALKDGAPTNRKSGRALLRSANMPSRPASADLRALKINGRAAVITIAIDLTQGAGVREATGQLSIDGVLYRPGFLQVTRGWASIGGSGDRAITVTSISKAAHCDRKDRRSSRMDKVPVGTAMIRDVMRIVRFVTGLTLEPRETLHSLRSRVLQPSQFARTMQRRIDRTLQSLQSRRSRRVHLAHRRGSTRDRRHRRRDAGRQGDLQQGYGLANTARNTPVTATTLFAVGSVTKQFHLRDRIATAAGREAVVRRPRLALSRRLRPRE
jgi:hypothetical protein